MWLWFMTRTASRPDRGLGTRFECPRPRYLANGVVGPARQRLRPRRPRPKHRARLPLPRHIPSKMARTAQVPRRRQKAGLLRCVSLAASLHNILPCNSLIRRAVSTDEHLQFLLILRVQPLADSLEDPAHPPIALLSFLAHVQVSYDASYISPVSLSSSPSPGFLTPAVRISTPPRASSLKPRVHIPPNIVPPTTPNPTPLTTEHDRRYVKAEGTPLASGVWGDAKDGKEAFALLWDAATKEWVAVYSMSVNVGERSSPAPSRARTISLCRSLSAHELARSFAVLDGLDDIAREAGIRHACAQAPCDPHRRSRRAPKNTRRAQRRR